MPATLAAYFHDLSPIAVKITDLIVIRWYGLSYVLGFITAYFILRWLSKRGAILIPRDRISDAMMFVVAGIIVGGRLTYCFIYDPSLLTDLTADFPFWGVFKIHHGGMASHGGMIGAVIAAWFVSMGFEDQQGRIVGKCHPLHVAEAFAFAAPFGLMLGRIANFVNGELLGKVIVPPGSANHAPWWTVYFPQELLKVDWTGNAAASLDPHAPALTTQQLAQLKLLALQHQPINAIGQIDDHSLEAVRRGIDYLVTHADRYKDQLIPFLSARAPSQILQALAEGPVLMLVLLIVWARPKKTGTLCATFLIAYGVLRVLTEFVRLPDAQFADGRPLGLSRGQWLSMLMIVIGVGVFFWARRNASLPRLGGWMKPARTIHM